MQGQLRLVAVVTVVAALAGAGCSNNDSQPSPPASLSSIALSTATVVSPNPVQGTVALTGPASAGGATVSLSSSSPAAVVPQSTLVAAGATTGTFTVTTAGSGSATITAAMAGVTRTAQLTVNPGLAANFTVASTQPARRRLANGTVEDIPGLGTGSADACPIHALAGSARTLACNFDGSTSTAVGSSIMEYQWTYAFGTQRVTEIKRSTDQNPAVLTPAVRDCSFFGNGTFQPTDTGGLRFIGMRVELRVLNAQNQLSDVKFSENVRIFPGGNCGYSF